MVASVRAARAASGLPLMDVAAAAGVSEKALRRALTKSAPRGVCAQAAANAAVVAHPMCPPAAVRSVLPAGMEPGRFPVGGRRHAKAASCSPADAAVAGPVSAQIGRLATRRDPQQRTQAASSPACPAEAFATLAEDPARQVREAVAANPNCPADLLAALVEDSAWQVSDAVAANPACPADALATYLR